MVRNRVGEYARVGLESALSAVNKLSGGCASVAYSRHGLWPLTDVRILSGSPEGPVLGAYIPYRGDARGHVVIFFRPDRASELVSALAPETTDGLTPEDIDQMRDSIVSEVANIIGTHLLNAMADEAGIKLVPNPPFIVSDMSGAILGSTLALAGIADDSVFVADLKVAVEGREVSYEVILLPEFEVLEEVLPGGAK